METLIVLSVINRTGIQKISKNIGGLNDTVNQLDLIDFNRRLYPKRAEYTFCSSAHVIWIMTDYVLVHRTKS